MCDPGSKAEGGLLSATPHLAAETNCSGGAALEKPLSELTEGDIAQLTREDCRRFLKEKGMRRPSWNKSQAIQQVISLKALLEAYPPDARPSVVRRAPAPKASSGPIPSLQEARNSQSPYRRMARAAAQAVPAAAAGLPSPENNCFVSRNGGEAHVGQLTVFYDGHVNVFDGVPPAKVRQILSLAAMSDYGDLGAASAAPPTLAPTAAATTPFAPPFHPIAGSFPPPSTDAGMSKWARVTVEADDRPSLPECDDPDGPVDRKASVQRYLEKRKARFMSKNHLGVHPSTTAVRTMCLNQKMQTHMSNNGSDDASKSDRSNVYSPPPPMILLRKKCPSFDLNLDGGEM